MPRNRPVAIVAALCLAWLQAHAAQTGADKVESAVDGEWVTINGVVQAVVVDSFRLDYGDGAITVELDGYRLDGETALVDGDQVTVSGRLYDDLHDRRSIDASSVYVDRLSTCLYADPADEEPGYHSLPVAGPATPMTTTGSRGR